MEQEQCDSAQPYMLCGFQAAVCGGSLALLSAGVPLKSPVAGVSIGLVSETKDSAELTTDDRYALLTGVCLCGVVCTGVQVCVCACVRVCVCVVCCVCVCLCVLCMRVALVFVWIWCAFVCMCVALVSVRMWFALVCMWVYVCLLHLCLWVCCALVCTCVYVCLLRSCLYGCGVRLCVHVCMCVAFVSVRVWYALVRTGVSLYVHRFCVCVSKVIK